MVQDYQPALLSGTRGELPKRYPVLPRNRNADSNVSVPVDGEGCPLGSVTALQTEMARLAEGRASVRFERRRESAPRSRSLTVPVQYCIFVSPRPHSGINAMTSQAPITPTRVTQLHTGRRGRRLNESCEGLFLYLAAAGPMSG